MNHMRLILSLWLGILLVVVAFDSLRHPESGRASLQQRESAIPASATRATRMLQCQPDCFVPNVGQWPHAARFVRRGAAMTVFLEDRGWILDLRKRDETSTTNTAKTIIERGSWHDPVEQRAEKAGQVLRGAAVRMSFVGASTKSRLVGGSELPGRYNYFLGNDETRWRTGVPRYAEVRYGALYPGIDMRLHDTNGCFEYDLLLEPGADLSVVSVKVEGADGMHRRPDGTLVIDTALGPIHQPKPVTWECLADGSRSRVECDYRLLGGDRFGFIAPSWDGGHALVVDPGLLWSTLIGGGGNDYAWAVHTDGSGAVTVGGYTPSTKFPTTAGAYNTTHSGTVPLDFEAFVSRFDPRRVGVAQLVYSTFLGGLGSNDSAQELSVDDSGVVTVGGYTDSLDFPTTKSAYQLGYGGGSYDGFVTQLDPKRTGSAQLIYSTYLGGRGEESVNDLLVSIKGVVTVAGGTTSPKYPTTAGAYGTAHNGSSDGFVTRLDPSLVGKAQMVYSSLLGGKGNDGVVALGIDLVGTVTVAGSTNSSDYPTTNGAFDRVYNGGIYDGFVSQLDVNKTGAGQLTYSTFLGGSGNDVVFDMAVDAVGVATVTGPTESTNFPTTASAFDTTLGGNRDAFVSRLDPHAVKTAQLVYSTYLGGVGFDVGTGLAVDGRGGITVGGNTASSGYPTTAGAYSTRHGGNMDIFVSRLDPSRPRATQMVYSTFLGGTNGEGMSALAVDPSGIATVVGFTVIRPLSYPTTVGAFDRTPNGGIVDAVASRLDMGVAMWGDLHRLSLKRAGIQTLHVNAGKQHAGRSYWLFGSATGTLPGVNLGNLHVPLNPDVYTNFTIGNANSTILKSTRGTLDANGRAAASFNVPSGLPAMAGFTLHHAYVVHDSSGRLFMASNAVPLKLTN
jgi:hypothetical protein